MKVIKKNHQVLKFLELLGIFLKNTVLFENIVYAERYFLHVFF